MKKYILISMLFAVLLLTSFTSALNVFPDKVTGNSSTINHGDSVQIAFSINNTFDKPVINSKINLPSLTAGSWSSAKLGSTGLTIQNNQIILPVTLKVAPNTLSEVISLTFSSNKYVSAGTMSNQVTFSGDYEGGSTNIVITPLSFSITINSSPSLTMTKNREINKIQNTSVLNITNAGNTALERITLSSSGNLNFTFSSTDPFSLAPGASKTIDVALMPVKSFKIGANTGTISAKSGDTQASTTFTLTESFCKNGAIGNNLTIRNAEITQYGDDDDTWKLLDSLKFEVEVKNEASDEVDDVIVEMGLFNSNGENVVNDLDFSNSDEEKIDVGNIKKGDEETVAFEFKVPSDFDTGNYKLAVKAYSDEIDEKALCADTSGDLNNQIYQDIKVEKEDDEDKLITFDNIKIIPSEATCKDEITLITDAVNIGDEDQDQVKVTLFNKELGLDMSTEIRNDLDQGDKEKLTFVFKVPQNITNKNYPLE
ncbi:MAG: putative S-layer protein, partial [Nanoarchaeota archaeon]